MRKIEQVGNVETAEEDRWKGELWEDQRQVKKEREKVSSQRVSFPRLILFHVVRHSAL